MRITKLPVVGVVCGLSLIAACHRSQENNNNTPDAFVNPTGACTPSGTRVQDVQNDAMAVGTPVTLSCVVVTALDAFGAKTGDIWVEDMGGGPYSGIHLFNPAAPNFNSLAVGDLVNITGAAKSEFPTPTTPPPYYSSVTELVSAPGGQLTVTKVGTGTAPAPYVLDLQTFASMSTAAQNAEYEKWEGVLITVNNVHSTGTPTGFGSVTPYPPDAFGVGIDANFTIDSNLAAFATSVDATTCFVSVTGVVDFAGSKWLIYPRTTDEMVMGGTSCFAGGPAVTTIPAIQAATPTGTIELDNVFVTGIAHSGRSFWLSSSLTAAQNQGVFVFGSAALDPAVVPGAQLKLIGTVQEFNDDTMGGTLTRVMPTQITVTSTTPSTPVPMAHVLASTLLDPTTGPTFESVLVSLDNVNITTIGDKTVGFVATATQNGVPFGMETNILQLTAGDPNNAAIPDNRGCYASIIGFGTNLEETNSGIVTHGNALGFIPLTLGTKQDAGMCN